MTTIAANPVAANPYDSPLAECDPSLVPADLAVGEEGWTVEYELTPRDIVEWSFYSIATSRVTKKSMRPLHAMGMIACLVPVFWIVILFKMAPVDGFMGVAVGFAIFVSLFVSFFGALGVYFNAHVRDQEALYVHPENANAIGARRMRLMPDALYEFTPTSRSTTQWQGITRVECQPIALYLLTSDRSAFIVPKRAFSDDVLFQQFAKVAAEFHARANRQAAVEAHRR